MNKHNHKRRVFISAHVAHEIEWGSDNSASICGRALHTQSLCAVPRTTLDNKLVCWILNPQWKKTYKRWLYKRVIVNRFLFTHFVSNWKMKAISPDITMNTEEINVLLSVFVIYRQTCMINFVFTIWFQFYFYVYEHGFAWVCCLFWNARFGYLMRMRHEQMCPTTNVFARIEMSTHPAAVCLSTSACACITTVIKRIVYYRLQSALGPPCFILKM